jgi:hypothetical protein
VIVDDFHIEAMTFAPKEADSPLIVDPDRMLALSIASQGLQLIPGWRG